MGGRQGESTGLYYKVVSWGRRPDEKVGWDFIRRTLKARLRDLVLILKAWEPQKRKVPGNHTLELCRCCDKIATTSVLQGALKQCFSSHLWRSTIF